MTTHPPSRAKTAPSFLLRRFLIILVLLAPNGCRSDSQREQDDASFVVNVFGGPGYGTGQFSYPRAVTVSPVDGRVFVVDKRARVQRFDPEGNYETEWRMPEFETGKPTGLHVDRDNRLWVADTHYARVICYDRDGRELRRFGSYGEGPGEFIFPECVFVDPEGFVYVGEYGGNDRISKFSPKLEYLFSFADKYSGDGWTDRPTEILQDETGILWVADCCNHRVSRYTREGKYLSSFRLGGDDPATLCYPYGMVMEKSGSLLLADRGNSCILRVSREGKVLGKWGSPGREPGRIVQPWGVAQATDGRIYCLDSWNNRVQVIKW